MNRAARRDRIIRTLQTEADGSFTVIHKALVSVARDHPDQPMSEKAVRDEIRKIRNMKLSKEPTAV